MEKSGFKTWAKRLTSFERPDATFELLETEPGQPSLFGGWRDEPGSGDKREGKASERLGENRARLYTEYRGAINTDLILRSFKLAGRVPGFCAFMNGMADADQVTDFILRPVMQFERLPEQVTSISAFAAEQVIPMQEAELTDEWETVKKAVSEGRTAVFFEGDGRALILDTRGFAHRSVSTPQNETVIMGPHEAFTEHMRTNVTLLRRILKMDDFVCEFRGSGGKNNTQVAIAYREGTANTALVNEVKKRIAGVDTLMVLSTGMLEQLTESHSISPLPQALSTERPDRAAAHIMQGHVVVLIEGSPMALVAPATLFALMSSAEDVYMRRPIGTIVRLVRYIGAFLSLIIPAYFIALALHHPGMLSGEVLSTVIASRNMVFLPITIEMIFLLLVFQLVREAGLSVPGVLGQSVGIIGGLILGQAAVSANIVSTVVLIIVALTGLGNFTIRDYGTQLAAAYFRIFLVLCAWIGGLLGLFSAVLLAVAWMAHLKSYGVPFLTPVSPKTNADGPMILRGSLRDHRRTKDYVNTRRRRA